MAENMSIRLWVALAAGLFYAALTQAETLFDYQLQPVQVAEGTWVVPGVAEDFSRSNGGNIVNIGFIETNAGVVLIDTGPSLRYAQQLEAAVARVHHSPSWRPSLPTTTQTIGLAISTLKHCPFTRCPKH